MGQKKRLTEELFHARRTVVFELVDGVGERGDDERRVVGVVALAYQRRHQVVRFDADVVALEVEPIGTPRTLSVKVQRRIVGRGVHRHRRPFQRGVVLAVPKFIHSFTCRRFSFFLYEAS